MSGRGRGRGRAQTGTPLRQRTPALVHKDCFSILADGFDGRTTREKKEDCERVAGEFHKLIRNEVENPANSKIDILVAALDDGIIFF